ncbi:MAG: hypothetical protein K6T83_08705 [Alicyclobacillus sp.]|nr:hypothetical protein [Alicyclobacillus sp.]
MTFAQLVAGDWWRLAVRNRTATRIMWPVLSCCMLRIVPIAASGRRLSEYRGGPPNGALKEPWKEH